MGGSDKIIEQYFEYVAELLDLFDGQLSITDIYKLSNKELEYLRKARMRIKMAKAGSMDEVAKTLNPRI